MRYSFESRCRLIALVRAGASPPAAAAPAAPAARPATGSGAASRRAAGRRCSSVRRCPAGSRGASSEAAAEILAARACAHAGPVIVGALLGRPASTVWKLPRRHGRSRLRLPARAPVERYERERPGELVHIDIKRLGRSWTIGKAILGERPHRSRRAGWQYLHLAIDDHSRLAYAELLPSESPADCVAFLQRAVASSVEQGITVERSSPTTATATAHRPGRPRARSSRSLAATRAHAEHKRTAKRKRSSRHSSANGLTALPPRQASTARKPSAATCAGTADTDRTAARRQAAEQPRLTGLWVPHLGRRHDTVSRSAARIGSYRRLPGL